ncbi:type I methionyl aminopeptidase [Dethiosulfatarculus sandiegensis]|jgi:methionyl aminopeptidase|uniref:Methionine aminopeptidase n=1 Tax=Dethiosulfatarculus sandiegensis TaxID=1429043 RepID=A0A0D2K323_9BACT|nr:type I methionyl aminopeptidase [Dethiosulfatarculus sandiegensis]KIX15975.1 methionine aminopeptidase [Dethiosulfatarculus sandiegensis]
MIKLKSPDEIQAMREANRVVGKVLQMFRKEVVPGISTAKLDQMGEELCRSLGAVPGFKGYGGFPYATCCSVNEQVVHGFPNKHSLKEGDIISLDFGAVLDGFNGDAAITLPVGEVSKKATALMKATEASLYAGIDQMKVGNRLGDISNAVQKRAESAGFSVVRQFVGHGIGRKLHEDPQVPNFGPKGRGVLLKEGMVLAVEPMINEGTWEVAVLDDGWTAVTVDGKLSAHYEHTVAITKDGPMILSLP